MKNPYMRSVLIASLVVSILFTLALVVGEWASSKSFSQYGWIDTSTSTWTSTVTPNVYQNTSETLRYVQTLTLMPLYPLFFVSNSFLVGFILQFIGPIIVFLSWFFIFYIATYLYAKFVKKNLTAEARSHNFLITICVVTIILLSVTQIIYFL